MPKCAIVRKNYPPGVHGGSKARRRTSEYGMQLAVKQRLKRMYGIRERQLKNYFNKVKGKSGDIGEMLLQKLEARLDNIVYRSGLARSRREARQMVNHGMFLVAGREVDIPSYEVKVGAEIVVKESKRKKPALSERIKEAEKRTPPADWVSVNYKDGAIKVLNIPERDSIGEKNDIQMVIEYYSR